VSGGGHRGRGAPGEAARGGGPAPAEAEIAELAADLQRLLLVSSRILRSHTASQAVSASQFSVLARLDRAGESTPGVLADFEHVSPPVMTRVLGRLEAAGLVHRSAHPEDGRQVRVTLTDEGRELVRAGRAERDAWLRSRLDGTSASERAELQEATALLRRTLVPPRD
jgi:DNA-binding MarR family transcriptional regulator